MTVHPTLTFSDIVKKIGKNPDAPKYSVAFRQHTSVYSVDVNNAAAVEALTESAAENVPVEVTVSTAKSKILDAKLVS